MQIKWRLLHLQPKRTKNWSCTKASVNPKLCLTMYLGTIRKNRPWHVPPAPHLPWGLILLLDGTWDLSVTGDTSRLFSSECTSSMVLVTSGWAARCADHFCNFWPSVWEGCSRRGCGSVFSFGRLCPCLWAFRLSEVSKATSGVVWRRPWYFLFFLSTWHYLVTHAHYRSWHDTTLWHTLSQLTCPVS